MTALMRSSVLLQTGHMEINNLPVPEPGPNDVRIRMRQVGICGSDMHIYAGHFLGIPLPLTLGHEGMGMIDKCGSNVSPARLGERGVIEPNFPCLECRYCKRGKGNICPNKRILGVRETGCFADYAIVPAEFVWPVPATISDDAAVMIEPSAVAYHALHMSSAKPGDTIAIIGIGTIGLLLAHFALALGYKVLVHDKITHKVDIAVGWGAVSANVDSQEQAASQLNKYFAEAGVETVFETTGSGKATALALDSAPRGAEIILVGMSTEPVPIVPFSLTRNGNHILTSMIYDHPHDFRQVIDLIAAGTIQPSRIISSRTNLENLPQTFEKLYRLNSETKVIVDFDFDKLG